MNQCPNCQANLTTDSHGRPACPRCPYTGPAKPPPGPRLIVGLDLGQTTDPTAWTVLQRTPAPDGARDGTRYDVVSIERFHLGTPYTTVADVCDKRMRQAPLSGSHLVVDQTGVGRAVVDLLRQKRMPALLRPVTITAGQKATRDEDGSHHVPKKDLVGVVQLLLQSHRLRIGRSLPEAALLAKELKNFETKITTSGNEVFGAWREGTHDDLVLAVALAAWAGENLCLEWTFSTSYDCGERGLMEQIPKGVFGEGGTLDHF